MSIHSNDGLTPEVLHDLLMRSANDRELRPPQADRRAYLAEFVDTTAEPRIERINRGAALAGRAHRRGPAGGTGRFMTGETRMGEKRGKYDDPVEHVRWREGLPRKYRSPTPVPPDEFGPLMCTFMAVWLTVVAGSAIYYLGRLILGIIGLHFS